MHASASICVAKRARGRTYSSALARAAARNMSTKQYAVEWSRLLKGSQRVSVRCATSLRHSEWPKGSRHCGPPPVGPTVCSRTASSGAEEEWATLCRLGTLSTSYEYRRIPLAIELLLELSVKPVHRKPIRVQHGLAAATWYVTRTRHTYNAHQSHNTHGQAICIGTVG